MTLLNAPTYNENREKLKTRLLIGAGVLFTALVVLTFAGYLSGHGWLFTNLPAEHRVDKFLTAIENKDFAKAYGIYVNDEDWQQHGDKYKDYPLNRFTEDWTTFSKVGVIRSHHVDISRTDGEGFWGTSVLVGTTVNGGPKKLFMSYIRKDGTLSDYTYHIIQY